MNIPVAGLLLGLSLCCALPAQADMYRWTDASGRSQIGNKPADIYKWTDASGKVHYGDKPADARASNNAKLLIAAPAATRLGMPAPTRNGRRYQENNDQPAAPAAPAYSPDAAAPAAALAEAAAPTAYPHDFPDPEPRQRPRSKVLLIPNR